MKLWLIEPKEELLENKKMLAPILCMAFQLNSIVVDYQRAANECRAIPNGFKTLAVQYIAMAFQ